MEKKTLIAVVLILAVFWVSNEFIWKPKAEAKMAEEKAKHEAEQVVNNELVPTPETTFNQDQVKSNIAPTLINSDVKIENNLELVTKLDKDNITYRFTNRGAVITNVVLAEYFIKDKETEEMSPVDLIPAESSIYNIVLNQRNGDRIDLSNIVFVPHISADGQMITFTYNSENGFIKKVYKITEKTYTIAMSLEMQGFSALDSYQIQMDDGIPDTESHLKMKSRDYQVAFQLNNEYDNFKLSSLKSRSEVESIDKLSEKFILNGKLDWAAVRSKYFIQALIPDHLIDMNKLIAFRTNGSPAAEIYIATSTDNFVHEYQLYFGPLVAENLDTFSNGLGNCVEAGPGFLKWLSKLFLQVYLFIHKMVPSWGFAVIIFAILLKTILYPLTHKSFESTTKMQAINPLMKELQAKYRSDPQKMNAELKALYKEHGVNPMGGCLPMLLQMPILFAIYPIFRYSINLRQSNFLWLPDLSEPDPFYILPIVMAIFMFLQQKLMAPSKDKVAEMDEKQQAAMQSQKMMMYMMPLMMLFFFRSLASGLVLYWTVFSVIGTVQQYYIKKKFI